MYRTGIATFGLDYGRCPPWLFERMTRLARLLTEAIVYQFGPEEFLRRLSDPFFFQSFGSVLAFDWDASGLTTTTTGALKEALRGTEKELGIFVAGGKGKTSRKTPEQITEFGDRHGINPRPLVYASKMSAKVDNTAVQDGFQLYHHTFIFTKTGQWTVIQQGMDLIFSRARRYHWLSEGVKDFTEEPHSGLSTTKKASTQKVLNLISRKSRGTKKVATQLVSRNFKNLLHDLKVLNFVDRPFNYRRLEKSLRTAHEQNPQNFEQLLGVYGVGPKTIRALSLISEIVYGAKPSYEDPTRYTYAHGGKDGIPYPVDRSVYDWSITVLEKALQKAKMGYNEKLKAFRRLSKVTATQPENVTYGSSSFYNERSTFVEAKRYK